MKPNSGIIAILTVFLAAFGISNLRKNNPSGAVSETTNKSNARAKPKASNTPTLSPACEEIGDRLKRFFEKKPEQKRRQIMTSSTRDSAMTAAKGQTTNTGRHFHRTCNLSSPRCPNPYRLICLWFLTG